MVGGPLLILRRAAKCRRSGSGTLLRSSKREAASDVQIPACDAIARRMTTVDSVMALTVKSDVAIECAQPKPAPGLFPLCQIRHKKITTAKITSVLRMRTPMLHVPSRLRSG
jgi:hypothetical protein